jgi:ATP-binding cassette subfamily F protein 3
VLGRNQPKADASTRPRKKDKRADARSRDEARVTRNAILEAEKLIAGLQARLDSIDQAMIDPASAPSHLAGLAPGELARRRADVAQELEAAESRWLAASENLEQQVA